MADRRGHYLQEICYVLWCGVSPSQIQQIKLWTGKHIFSMGHFKESPVSPWGRILCLQTGKQRQEGRSVEKNSNITNRTQDSWTHSPIGLTNLAPPLKGGLLLSLHLSKNNKNQKSINMAVYILFRSFCRSTGTLRTWCGNQTWEASLMFYQDSSPNTWKPQGLKVEYLILSVADLGTIRAEKAQRRPPTRAERGLSQKSHNVWRKQGNDFCAFFSIRF